MEKEFMDYPIKYFNDLYYIEVDNFRDAMTLKDLWNTDSQKHRIAFAQFPEKKDWQPFDGNKYYIWLRISQFNTNG